MGVTGSGKTTVGRALSANLGWRFADADDYHSAANVSKMAAGIPLTDKDRAPWLLALRQAVVEWTAAGENVVLACSALKAAYREELVTGPEVKLVYLKASMELIAQRLAGRSGHFMNPHLLQSQFDALEEPYDVVTVDAGLPLTELVLRIRRALAL